MESSKSPPTSLEVLTLNCWGLKYIAKFRNARLREIGRRLSTRSPVPQIVGLQECWTQEDYRSIRDQTRHILPYGKFYHSGIFGGGLAILSKWPIQESSMVRYPLNGRPTAFFRGDWFVGKGVACAKIRIGPSLKDVVEVFCTHLHAPYEKEPHDSYMCHRTAQAWEIAKLMRGATERGHLVIALGDFNMVPSSLAHRIVTTHGMAKDVWRALHPDSSLGAAVDKVEAARDRPKPSIEYNLIENGTTCDSALNTWRWEKSKREQLNKGIDVTVEHSSVDMHAKRLDYIFVGLPQLGFGPSDDTNSSEWSISEARVGMTERHPDLRCSLSDHFSVETTLLRVNSGTEEELDSTPPTKEANFAAHGKQAEHLPVATYDEILSVILNYSVRERRQRQLRLSHMLVQTLISIGCFVAVWWSPHNFIAFILVLLSTLGFGIGIVDGLIGGLFVGSELRALKEFKWDIKNAKMLASGLHERENIDSEDS
ncbi:MAG: U3 snoRNP protein [Chaenotheca gracillima]|nr:MAG: U3 snoRNP protein [Chaenotheca gracillima]